MRRGPAILALVGLAALGATAEAGAPTDQLKGATDRVLGILQDPQLETKQDELVFEDAEKAKKKP